MARWYAGLVASALLTASAGVAARASEGRPCPRGLPPAQMVREVSHVFEGVVVDRSNEIIADPFTDGGRTKRQLRTLRSYHFRVLRNWTGSSREFVLTHGWYEGARGWTGRYPDYDFGTRYLVFASSHDMPAHTFTSSCLPGASGDAIPALAAQLGPPRATYEVPPAAPGPFWQHPVRRAREYMEALRALIQVAVD
jgi:hypothetical protein